MNFDHYFGPMTREYDFSGLSRPLQNCVRTYASRTSDGRYEVLVVQDETSLGLDTVIYITSVARSAQNAAVEVEGMIKAAKLLAGKS
jgi:hypothetical protein